MIRMHSSWRLFAGRKIRHPVFRVVLALIGIALLGMLLVLGLIAGLGMILFGLLRRALSRRTVTGAPAAAGNVIDGEYHVVNNTKASLAR